MNLKPYHEKVKTSRYDDEMAILSLLKDRLASVRHSTLPLMNVFKGIPISNQSELLTVNDKFAQFKTNPVQIAAIHAASETVIRFSSDNEAVIGKLNSLDTARNIVSLKEFAFAHFHVHERTAVRVQLLPPVDVVLTVDGNKLTGVVRDISLDGCNMSTTVGSILQRANSIKLHLKFMHNSEVKQAGIPARVLRIHEGMPSTVVLLFNHTSDTEHVLSTFLNQRQIDIIRELKGKC
jgi:hypothetical protein